MTGYGGQPSLFVLSTKLTIDRRLTVQQLSVSSPLICLFIVAISSSGSEGDVFFLKKKPFINKLLTNVFMVFIIN